MSRFDRPPNPDEHMAALALQKRELGLGFDEAKHRRANGYPAVENPQQFDAAADRQRELNRKDRVETAELRQAREESDIAALRADNEDLRERMERMEHVNEQLLAAKAQGAPPAPPPAEDPSWITEVPTTTMSVKRINTWLAQRELELLPKGTAKIDLVAHALAVGQAASLVTPEEVGQAREKSGL